MKRILIRTIEAAPRATLKRASFTNEALRVSLASILGLVASAIMAMGSDWPGWRGPQANGVVSGISLATQWGTNQNILWTVEIPGAGWAQPVVWKGKIFLTTAVTANQKKPKGGEFDPGVAFGGRGPRGPGGPGGPGFGPRSDGDSSSNARPSGAESPGPSDRRGPPFGGQGGFTPPPPPPAPDAVYQWKVICLDAGSGKILWDKTAREGRPATPIHRNNTYASETPVTDGELLFAYFGMHGLYSFDLDGKLKWRRDLGSFPTQMGWGSGSSPILYGDLVYVQCDNDKESFLLAVDKKTGKDFWKVPRDEKSNWSTPYIWRNHLRTELVTGGGKMVRSYNPENGQLLWELSANGRTAITPVGDDDFLYVDSFDRMMGGRGTLVAVKAGGKGDISLGSGDTNNNFVAWCTRLSSYRVASPLVYAGCLYQLDQQSGMVRCFDAKTGESYYKERLPGARGFTASPWASDGKVFCLDETGTTFALSPGRHLEIASTNRLEETMWASPAVAGDRLLLRGVDHLYCIGTAR
jgi:outer membrane protein assembly factor BamB